MPATTALERLAEMGLELPVPPEPLFSYVPVRRVPIGGGRVMLFVSGQVALRDGTPVMQGRVPDEVSIEEAEENARLCALNILAQVHRAVGLDNVEQVANLNGFVLSSDTFGEQPRVINAASNLLVEVLGEAGRHSRIALGTNALPFSVPVEIAAVVVARDVDTAQA
jgi:enamine deaminase RidA (YjgF/YER057c/UK114 family)